MRESALSIRTAARTRDATRWLPRLASLRLTLVLIVLLAAGTVTAYQLEAARTWPMVVPLLLLAINLIAAIACTPSFRRQGPLLMFHLGLLALILLVAAGRMTYLRGQLELTSGAEFAGELTHVDAGPLHAGNLAAVRFVSQGFEIDYDEGRKRGPTRNTVMWREPGFPPQIRVIGDQTPLILEGYRFYTSYNKGFAPLFRWEAAGGAQPEYGSVHLPSFPIYEYEQATEWSPPGSRTLVWIMLEHEEDLLDIGRPDQFRLPGEYSLIVRVDETRHVLQVGDAVDLPGGRLVFTGLTTWMGYNVFYDWTLPWLAAACAVSVASLGLHFWRKFSARPWDA